MWFEEKHRLHARTIVMMMLCQSLAPYSASVWRPFAEAATPHMAPNSKSSFNVTPLVSAGCINFTVYSSVMLCDARVYSILVYSIVSPGVSMVFLSSISLGARVGARTAKDRKHRSRDGPSLCFWQPEGASKDDFGSGSKMLVAFFQQHDTY